MPKALMTALLFSLAAPNTIYTDVLEDFWMFYGDDQAPGTPSHLDRLVSTRRFVLKLRNQLLPRSRSG